MKTIRIVAVAVLIVVSSLALHLAPAQDAGMAGIKRTDLQRHDLSAQGREVVQAIVGFDQGVAAPR